MTPDDSGLRVVVRAADLGGARPMVTYYDHGNLVTPWLVRRAIDHALANGWDPRSRGPQVTFRIAGTLDDRRVEVPAAAELAVREEDLIDRIADQDDRESREVYADWLMERGDPRGEFIMLTYALESGVEFDAEDRARLQELAALREKWLGPIVDVTRGRWWKYGLFDSCQLGKRVPGAVDRALGHPAWATVRSIDAHGEFMTADSVARLVVHPVLRSLRSLAMDHRVAKAVVEMPGQFPRVREIAIAHGSARYAVLAALDDRMVLEGGKITAHVKSFGDLVGLLANTKLAEIVVIDPTFEKFATWLPALTMVPSARIECVRFAQIVSNHTIHGARLDVRRAIDGRWGALTVGWSGPDWQHARDTVLGALGRIADDALIGARVEREPVAPLGDRAFRVAVLERLARQRGFQDFGAT